MSARRVAVRRACKAGTIPTYAADLVTVRGRCQHGRCKGRWAVVRVSLDFRAERVDRLAVTICATCGRVWRRIRPPALRSAAGYQAVRLTLILPPVDHRRWFSRGRWHAEGTDAVILREATLTDLDEAAREHMARADALIDARTRRKAREDAATAELMARYRAADEARAAARAEREAEEAAAAAREAAYAA